MSRKRAPCVDVRTDVFKDERFAALAQVAGYSRFEAVGRMIALWSWCIDRGLRDAPDDEDGYVVSEGVVRQFLGPSGALGLLAEDCEELALGQRRDGGRYYLKGTSEYVSQRRMLLKTSVAGGAARAATVRANDGRFVSEPTIVQPSASHEPAVSQPDSSHVPSCQPAASSDLPSSGKYIQRRHPDCGRVSRAVWNYAAKTHSEIRLAGIDKQAPPWPLLPDANSLGWTLLLDRVEGLLVSQAANDAERVGLHRVDVAAASARKANSLRWFSAVVMFKAENFERAAAMSIDTAAEPDRAKAFNPRDEIRRSKPL
jgi:hypothetical protein